MTRLAPLALGALLVLTACRTDTATAPATPPTASTASTPADTAIPDVSTPPVASTAPSPTKPPVKLIKIPHVVGVNHQTAQDTMQAAGLFNLREQDATGQGRLLVWDRNWVVVRQSPPAGRRVAPDTVITLFSKKIGE